MKDLTHLLGKKFKTGHTPPRAARVVCVDVDSESRPIIALIRLPDGYEYAHTYTKELKFIADKDSLLDLTEVTPYDDFNIDDKVIVWDDKWMIRHNAHFAGINNEGKPLTFSSGRTSWSSKLVTLLTWDNCIKFEEDK